MLFFKKQFLYPQQDSQQTQQPAAQQQQLQPEKLVSKQGIEIRKPKYELYKEGVEVYGRVLPTHFLSLAVGRPGSGKSHLLYEMIDNPDLYFKKFNFVYFITPGNIGDLQMTKDNRSLRFDLDWIFKKIEAVNQQIKARQATQKVGVVNILFVLDDCISDIKKAQTSPLLGSLIFNRRHLVIGGTVSLLITAQYYKAIPRYIRANTTSLMIFDIIPEDFKIIQQEVIYCKKKQQIIKIAEKIFQTKYAFMYVRIDTGDIYLNFKTLIYSPDAEELREIQDNQNAILGEGIPQEMDEEIEEEAPRKKNSSQSDFDNLMNEEGKQNNKTAPQDINDDYITQLMNKYKNKKN